MKIEKDDDPLMTSTFETRLNRHDFEIQMKHDGPETFHGFRVTFAISHKLNINEAEQLSAELFAWAQQAKRY